MSRREIGCSERGRMRGSPSTFSLTGRLYGAWTGIDKRLYLGNARSLGASAAGRLYRGKAGEARLGGRGRKKEGRDGRRAFRPAPAPEGEEIALVSWLRGALQHRVTVRSVSKTAGSLASPSLAVSRPPGACFPLDFTDRASGGPKRMMFCFQ